MPEGHHHIVVEVADGAERLAEALAGAPWLTTVERTGPALEIAVSDVDAAQRAIPRAVAELGLAVRRLETGEASLEDVFVGVVGGGER